MAKGCANFNYSSKAQKSPQNRQLLSLPSCGLVLFMLQRLSPCRYRIRKLSRRFCGRLLLRPPPSRLYRSIPAAPPAAFLEFVCKVPLTCPFGCGGFGGSASVPVPQPLSHSVWLGLHTFLGRLLVTALWLPHTYTRLSEYLCRKRKNKCRTTRPRSAPLYEVSFLQQAVCPVSALEHIFMLVIEFFQVVEFLIKGILFVLGILLNHIDAVRKKKKRRKPNN